MNGRPVANGEIVRLEHCNTHGNLHSHPIQLFCTSDNRQHEVSCFGHDESGDDNDDWRVECGGVLVQGMPFRLIHVKTNHALHSHDIVCE
jgi:dolichyl-phosphate-mannose--protein O-mannosyl transferase